MKNTGYVCLKSLLRMLKVKAESKNLESSFSEGGDNDLEIIKAAKQLELKVKLSTFNRKTFSKHNIPVID